MIECHHAKTPEQFDHVRKLFKTRINTITEGHNYTPQYLEPFFEKARQDGRHHFFVSYEDGEPVAYLQIRTSKPNNMHLAFSFTHPDFHNKGHSQELLRTALKTLKPEHVTYDIAPSAPFDATELIEKILEEYHGNK